MRSRWIAAVAVRSMRDCKRRLCSDPALYVHVNLNVNVNVNVVFVIWSHHQMQAADLR